MGAEKFQLVVGGVGLGRLDEIEIGEKNMMPSSCTGGTRCMTKDFHNAVAVSRIHASPDISTAFVCDPKWPEIVDSLEPGQKIVDRLDVLIHVYHMKLLEYLQKIRNGRVFPIAVDVLHTVEFQKRGLPHAHIFVWQKKDDAQESELAGLDADGTAPANTMEIALV